MKRLLICLFLFSPLLKGEDKINILVVEHATPEFPIKGTKMKLGDLDVPLSEHGREEARLLKRQMEKCGITFDVLFSSDLERAEETAQILASGTGVEVETLRVLRETNKGDLQGLTQQQYRQRDSYKIYKALGTRERFFAPMGAGDRTQTKADLAGELIPFLEFLRKSDTLYGKTILIVTHGNPWKVIDILSRIPESFDTSKSLRNRLTIIPGYSSPKSCELFLYTLDKTSFKGLGQLHLSNTGETHLTPVKFKSTS